MGRACGALERRCGLAASVLRAHRQKGPLLLAFVCLAGLAAVSWSNGTLPRALAALGGRGDCNNDAFVDAGDISATILEIFDNDGAGADQAPGGTFPGDPEGCDSNGDLMIDAGDVSCTVLVIFGGPGACGPKTATPTATSADTATHTPSPSATGTATPTGTHTPTPTETATETQTATDMPSATKTPTATASPTPAYSPPDTIAGVQVDESDVITPVMDRLAQAGIKFTRVRVLWRWIEYVDKSPPEYAWGETDARMTGLSQYGLEPIGVIYNHPPWASTTSCGPIDLAPLSRYGDFVAALVERYDGDGTSDAPGSPRVAYWEIGNEEEFNPSKAAEGDYGSCFGGKAPDYGAYLRTAYLAAKQADSTCAVLFGGLAYDRFYNKSGYEPVGPFDYTFTRSTLDWLYTNHGSESAWPFFDAMNVHIYNDYRNMWDGALPYDQELVGKVKHLRTNQLVHSGMYDLSDIPMVSTEVGLPSMPTDAWTNRDETTQAAYPGQVTIRAMAAGLSAITWYTTEDYTGGRCNYLYDWLLFGLLRSLGVYQAAQSCGTSNPIPDYYVEEAHEPKPSHTAYGAVVSQLAGATYDRQLTTSETGSANIEAHRFTAPDDSSVIASFTDTGERLGRKGYTPKTITMYFSASILPGWTGSIEVVDYLGNSTVLSGSSIPVTVTQWPIYVSPN